MLDATSAKDCEDIMIMGAISVSSLQQKLLAIFKWFSLRCFALFRYRVTWVMDERTKAT